MAEELTCQELIEIVTDYLEGALPPAERMRFEDHLKTCTGCTRYLAQMRQTIEAVGELREDQLDLEAKSELLALFRDWKAGTLPEQN